MQGKATIKMIFERSHERLSKIFSMFLGVSPLFVYVHLPNYLIFI